MSSDEFREEPANPPIGSGPPPVATRGKKPNGEDEPTLDVAAKPASGKGAKAKAPEPPVDEDDDYQPIDIKPGSGPNGETTPEDLDEDARRVRASPSRSAQCRRIGGGRHYVDHRRESSAEE